MLLPFIKLKFVDKCLGPQLFDTDGKLKKDPRKCLNWKKALESLLEYTG